MENTAVTKKVKSSEEALGTVSIVLHDSDDEIPDLDSLRMLDLVLSYTVVV